MQLLRHCTAVLLALITATAASAQTPAPAAPEPGEATFEVFLRGAGAGRIVAHLTRTAAGWTISSTGRVGDLVTNRFELKYSPDWQPTDLRIEATQGQKQFQISTSFGVTTAINEITQNGTTSAKTDQVSARTVVLPNNFFAAYEALAVRLAGSEIGAEIPLYVAPTAEVKMTVVSVTPESIRVPGTTIATRKYAVRIQNVGATVDATITIDGRSRFARLEMPAAGLSVVRNDLAGVSARTMTARNPTDSDVTIPGAGFNLAGTLTVPPGVGRLRHATIVLVAGSGPVDRDESVAGIPIFSQLAGALAERGFLVLRYDKRGVGQSGGRTETVTMQDYADDLIGIVKWLAKRDDVDPRRITIVGHSEGGSIGMLAGAKEKRIASLVLVASIGMTGADLVLEQQRHQLERMEISDADRQAKIDLQRKIQQAVITDKGWETVPPDLRKQADTPWFRSLLMFDPARVMPDVKQPLLIVQGDLDTQVAPGNAEKLAELARARKKAGSVDVVHLPGINHLLVKATTGEVSEYSQLPDKTIDPEIADRIAIWLKK
jgi:uncharacterized protein